MTMNSKSVAGAMRKLSRFGRNKSGQVALIFGLSAVPLVGVGGMAVDLTRRIEAQAQVQSALDGAAMAATAALNAGENQAAFKKAAQDFFDHNKPDNLVGNPQVNVVLNSADATLSVSTDAAIATTMSKILGVDSLELRNDHAGGVDPVTGASTGSMGATVSLPAFTQDHKGEITMVMDYSGSMNWYLGGERKYITMRNEAAKLVSALSQAKTSNYVKFGVVPFSSEVFTTMKKKFWYGFKGNQMRASCTRDRKSPYNLQAIKPTNPGNKKHKTRFGWVAQEYSSNPNNYGFYQGWENYRGNCSSYDGWRNLVIQDLTDNHNDTYNKILSMSPYANTHIALGMEFGYHLLSPAKPFNSGVAYNTADTEKAVILLTDGAQTTKAFGAGGSYSVNNGENNLAAVCTKMKNDGIRILTVSYDLYNAQTEQRLKDCATDPTDFYDADNKPELIAAFSGITGKLARDMFLAK